MPAARARQRSALARDGVERLWRKQPADHGEALGRNKFYTAGFKCLSSSLHSYAYIAKELERGRGQALNTSNKGCKWESLRVPTWAREPQTQRASSRGAFRSHQVFDRVSSLWSAFSVTV